VRLARLILALCLQPSYCINFTHIVVRGRELPCELSLRFQTKNRQICNDGSSARSASSPVLWSLSGVTRHARDVEFPETAASGLLNRGLCAFSSISVSSPLRSIRHNRTKDAVADPECFFWNGKGERLADNSTFAFAFDLEKGWSSEASQKCSDRWKGPVDVWGAD